MKLPVVIAFGLMCGLVHGATYNEGKKPGGEPEHPDAPTEEHHPLPNEEETLHEGLKYKGKKGGQVRAAAALDANSPNVQKQIVDIHNTHRRRIPTTSTFRMSWDASAQKIAQQWAEKCEFRHPNEAEKPTYMTAGKYKCGQNIAMGTGSDMDWKKVISDMWHGEIKDFKYGQQSTKVVGHYTQVVWKNTHKVGCGYKMCPAKNGQSAFHFFVCDYCPAGNVYPDQFKPYDNGPACGKCPNDCDNGLCKTPCQFQNEYSNCEAGQGSFPALFPNGCKEPKNGMESHCQATCSCYKRFPY